MRVAACHGLGAAEVRGRLGARREPPSGHRGVDVHDTGPAEPGDVGGQGRTETGPGEDGGEDPAGQLAQGVQRCGRPVDQRVGGGAAALRRRAEVGRQRREQRGDLARDRALEPAPLGVAGLDQPQPGRRDLCGALVEHGDPGGQLGLQPGVPEGDSAPAPRGPSSSRSSCGRTVRPGRSRTDISPSRPAGSEIVTMTRASMSTASGAAPSAIQMPVGSGPCSTSSMTRTSCADTACPAASATAGSSDSGAGL